MKRVRKAIRATAYWTGNLLSFRPAKVIELFAGHALLFQGATCTITWRTKHAYGVVLYLDGVYYQSYSPNGFVQVPVTRDFRIEIIAKSIYGGDSRSIALRVNPLQFNTPPEFTLNAAAQTRPLTHRGLTVAAIAMRARIPAPAVRSPAITLEDTLSVRSREALEQEIIANAYQS